MLGDYTAPVELQFVSTIGIPDIKPVDGTNCPLMQLSAIAFADFRVIYQALINRH